MHHCNKRSCAGKSGSGPNTRQGYISFKTSAQNVPIRNKTQCSAMTNQVMFVSGARVVMYCLSSLTHLEMQLRRWNAVRLRASLQPRRRRRFLSSVGEKGKKCILRVPSLAQGLFVFISFEITTFFFPQRHNSWTQ